MCWLSRSFIASYHPSSLVLTARLRAGWLDSCPETSREGPFMATHEPDAAPPTLTSALTLTNRENSGGSSASPPALGARASSGPKRRPCQELQGNQEVAEAEYCAGPPSKRWRESAGAASWESGEETAAPGADSCQQTSRSPTPAALQPGSCQKPGSGHEVQAGQASPQADAAAADQLAQPLASDLQEQQAVVLPEWCDKAPTLWVPEDGQVSKGGELGTFISVVLPNRQAAFC